MKPDLNADFYSLPAHNQAASALENALNIIKGWEGEERVSLYTIWCMWSLAQLKTKIGDRKGCIPLLKELLDLRQRGIDVPQPEEQLQALLSAAQQEHRKPDGCLVVVQGLLKEELNGQHGRIVDHIPGEPSRYHVTFENTGTALATQGCGPQLITSPVSAAVVVNCS